MKRDYDVDRLIAELCAHLGITRAQYDAESPLQQETIDALVELQNSDEDDPVIPLGLAGAGKRRSALTADETEQLSWNEIELEELLWESAKAGM